MSELLSVGYGNFVPLARVVAIVMMNSAPAARLKKEALAVKKVIDATQGRKTRTLILMDTGHIVLSGLTTLTVKNRCDRGVIYD